jgi:hypothetical protein
MHVRAAVFFRQVLVVERLEHGDLAGGEISHGFILS